jgi:hypothetical protein
MENELNALDPRNAPAFNETARFQAVQWLPFQKPLRAVLGNMANP